MTAFAGNFHFVTAGVFAPVAAELLALRYIALARLVSAFTLLVFHLFLLGAKRGAGVCTQLSGPKVSQR